MKVRLTLVSASPRRQQLLSQLNIPFDVAPSNSRELWVGDSAESLAKINAERKATDSKYFGHHDRLLLSADTIIHFDGQYFGKPSGEHAARRMLEKLSGRWHEVVTGFCLVAFKQGGSIHKLSSSAVSSHVRFGELSKTDIESYLSTKEWQGKAGAYAIQGEAGKFALEISGDCDNIVGLPIGSLREKIGIYFSDCEFL